MKYLRIIFGMLAMMLTFGIAVTGCDVNMLPENQLSFPEAKGKLTVEGLDGFNDEYIYVQGMAGSNLLFGLTGITGYPSDVAYELVQISGGKAEIPLYTSNPSASSYSDSYFPYSGSDNVFLLNIIILSESSLTASNALDAMVNNIDSKTLISGTFLDGDMAIDWGGSGGHIQLAENQWVDGDIAASNGEQWFTFTATAYTQYIHVSFGTLTDLYVQLYDSHGNTIGNSANLYSSTRSIVRSLTPGQNYFIKVWPFGSRSGSYRIAFNASSSSPAWVPPGAVPVQLTVSHWADGNITASNGEQWFTFTATAYTQYIHVSFGTLTDLYVQLYDSHGYPAGSSTNLYSSTRSTTRSLTPGQNYFIKVWPFGSGSGSYRIAFNTSSSTPSGGWVPSGGTPIQLTLNQWADGNIPTSSGEQWFVFTATASTQYIHVNFGTLNDLYVHVYNDSNGNTVGSSANLYGSTRSSMRSLTIGQRYYIRVWPFGSRSGSYQISFNTASAAPGTGGGGGGLCVTPHVYGNWIHIATSPPPFNTQTWVRYCRFCVAVDTHSAPFPPF